MSDLILVPRTAVRGTGIYRHYVNGVLVGEDRNLLPTEGLNYLLDVAVGAVAKPAGFFIALFSGAVAPAAAWTAANFASTAGEIVSTTEGYTGARPAYAVAASSSGLVTNANARATFNMVSASAGTITVQGAAVLTSSVRGGTTGILLSASRYGTARTFQNGDIYDCEYELQLTAV